VGLILQEIGRYLEPRKIKLEVSGPVKDHLAQEGVDPHYGARPLRRLVQNELQNALAMKVLAGEIGDGDEVVVDMGENGSLSWTVRPAQGDDR